MSKFVDKLKKRFESMSQEELDKEWEELKHWNKVGPSIGGYFKFIKKIIDISK